MACISEDPTCAYSTTRQPWGKQTITEPSFSLLRLTQEESRYTVRRTPTTGAESISRWIVSRIPRKFDHCERLIDEHFEI